MSKKTPESEQEIPTTGHSWDGIQEYDNPMPRWWLWTFYATIVWGIGYTIAFPAWPMIREATPGLLGFSTRQEVARDIAAVDEANAQINAQLAGADLNAIEDDPELNQYAINAGGAIFRTWCAQCHGSGAAGARGFPNLLDDDWLWGGTIEDIHYTVAHGIRNEEDPDARFSQMPAFGEILSREEIDQVVNYVMSLSGEPRDADAAETGAQLYADNCATCHADDGTGDRSQGAPNLTDAIWLYSGDYNTLVESVTYARYGVMPHWSGRLSDAQLNAVSAYVHQLGGGEEMATDESEDMPDTTVQ
ncbi:cytochrome-c oxidase, cbb3-type subunit III [Qingshengfaniella alkalisoli]|uniref:Cbb3-type cytochrome c oxidase subunit n=1 Tax=Qingshengfaniella alkalisoli TaxID=2599296 RepID=A0A5B8IYM0_9RHOB|nr:cytochrome-c oxidase, cbb3-type subunit III [Qingshengfaniella alkalisoli]QDY71222.1 cytochrome-c oxidase, cbb3-type subunit III [Qingshengfaniella alkalisoli]